MEAQVLPLQMTDKLMGLVAKYWQDVWEGHREGKLVAWCSGFCPHELLKAMDISIVYLEGYAGVCSMAGISTDLCQRAETVGYSSDLCSLIRNFIGATQGIPAPDPQTLPFGGLPQPDLMICQPYCPGIYKVWEQYSRLYDIPLIVMEKPRIHDALSREEIDKIIRDGVEELKGIAATLEKITGKKLDYARLSQNLGLEKEASRLWWEVVGMCRNIPSPLSVFDIFSHVLPFTIYRGETQAVTYYQELKAELVERMAQNILPLAKEEKYRLYWDNLPIYFRLGEHMQKFASYGAVPVAAMFPYYFGNPDLDPERPLESIVELFLFNPNNRGLTGRIDFLTSLIEDYAIDGFVMQRSRTCLLTNVGQDDIMKALIKKTGLPAVVIEGDMCDARFYSDAEVDGKIDAFMEILARRGPRGKLPAEAGGRQRR